MFKTNEYFDGTVVSVALQSAEGKTTVGVMAAGEYEFGTSSMEIMTVLAGAMTIQQAGESTWTTYKKFESFVVPANSKYKAKVSEDTPYLCLYK